MPNCYIPLILARGPGWTMLMRVVREVWLFRMT